MDSQTTAKGTDIGSESPVDDSPSIIVKRQPFPEETSPGTDIIPDDPFATDSFAAERTVAAPARLEGVYRETIREWWLGKIQKVHFGEAYFEALLQDGKGVTSIAEFDINSVFQGYTAFDIEQYLYQGSEFVMYVTTIHGRGAPQTISCVEFIPPYIWKKRDDERENEQFKDLFPDDPFRQD